MRLLPVAVLLAVAGCVPARYFDYVPAKESPQATIRFAAGPAFGPYVDLFFFGNAETCTSRYVFGTYSTAIDWDPIRFEKNKRFAFTYRFEGDIGPGVWRCGGTYEFTPVDDAYTITLVRDARRCHAVVAGSGPAAVPVIPRRGLVPDTEDGAWCAPGR